LDTRWFYNGIDKLNDFVLESSFLLWTISLVKGTSMIIYVLFN
jgi:hypothetical protein